MLTNVGLREAFLLRCTIGLFAAQSGWSKQEGGIQECRRWKLRALCGQKSEFIAAQPQTTLNAK